MASVSVVDIDEAGGIRGVFFCFAAFFSGVCWEIRLLLPVSLLHEIRFRTSAGNKVEMGSMDKGEVGEEPVKKREMDGEANWKWKDGRREETSNGNAVEGGTDGSPEQLGVPSANRLNYRVELTRGGIEGVQN